MLADEGRMELWTAIPHSDRIHRVESFPLDEAGKPVDVFIEKYPDIPRPDVPAIFDECIGKAPEGGFVRLKDDYCEIAYYTSTKSRSRLLEIPAGEDRFRRLWELPEEAWENALPPLSISRTQALWSNASRTLFFSKPKKLGIYYIPGFASGVGASTGKALIERFPHARILSYDSAGTLSDNLKSLVGQLDTSDTARIFVGSSLGAYYAAHLCVKTKRVDDRRLILINPAINPGETLKQFIGKNTSLDTGTSFELPATSVESYEVMPRPGVKTVVLISKNDTLLDPQKMHSFFEPFADIISVEGGHRLEDIEMLFEAIENLSGSKASISLYRRALSQTEHEVLSLRFRLKDEVFRSRKELAKIFGETPERVAEVEQRAMEKICGSPLYRYIKKHKAIGTDNPSH